MFERLNSAIGGLAGSLAALDPELMDGSQAARLAELCVHVERVGASMRLRAARRVEQTKAYGQTGHRSAASWLAELAGTSTGQATSALATAQQLEGLTVTADALAAGLISEAEAAKIASAASVDATAESELLDSAQHESHEELRAKAARRRAAAMGQHDRDERIRANRRLSDWSDQEGAICVALRMAPGDGARLLAAVDARAEKHFKAAYKAGRREPLAAYRLDALLSLVQDAVAGGGSGRRGVDVCINVLIDHSALVRGSAVAGERCEIAGVGPISVATARALLGDAFLKLIVTNGVDVYNVTHAGRTVPAAVLTALIKRDPVCSVPGCGETDRLENHHYKIDYNDWKVTRLDGLARLCHWHHRQATLGRARLSGSPGHWEWTDLTSGTADPNPARAKDRVAPSVA